MRAFAGVVAGAVGAAFYSSQSAPAVQAAPAGPFSPEEFRDFSLISSYDESHDTKVFRFALPESDMKCNLACASCIVCKFTDKEGNAIIRPYTPISRVDQLGYFELMIKKYKGSKMGSHTHALKRGDKLSVKGPFVKIPIKANQYRQIGMLCGGTGIAPMFQVAHHVLNTSGNKTNINMVYANRRKEDVLLGNEINELMMAYPNFSPYFVLSKAPSDWMGGIGHVNKDIVKAFMPGPDRASDSVVLVCGPPGFMKDVCGDKDFKTSPPSQGELSGMLKEMGYSSKQVFKF
jgi:cytochrome-b5 reductase